MPIAHGSIADAPAPPATILNRDLVGGQYRLGASYTRLMRFAPEYVSSVLNENFEDAKRLFLSPLIAIHYAHLVMLAERAIVTAADARLLRHSLDALDEAEVGRAVFDGTFEDLFFYVNRLIEASCGPDVASRLHTARSRNDIDMTLYRMRQRQDLLGLAEACLHLRTSLLGLAVRHRDTILALHTHTQPAQPSTVAHYLLAVLEQLERDVNRLREAYGTTNRSPLGSCAITGTGFPIDRELTADLLGFDGPTGNTYGSIGAADWLLQNTGAAAVLLAGTGRVVQDFLSWCTVEFGYLRLGDGFVQGSSIMPQKRNPVALEHARALCSRALGEAMAVVLAVHNTPFGDIVDTEDDLQPLVDSVFRGARRAVTLVAAAMATAEFDAAALERRAGEGGTTLTELADTLVRDHGLCFGTAHTIAARVAAAGDESAASVIARASSELIGRALQYDEAALRRILSPRHFVEVRRTTGGPAPERIIEALEASAAALARDREWAGQARARLAAADARRLERSRQL